MKHKWTLFFAMILAALALTPAHASDNKVADVDPAIYDEYVGEYELVPEFVLTVRRDGDRLMTQGTGQPEIEILPKSETVFFNEEIGGEIVFVRDDGGKVTSIIMRQGGREITGKRLG